MGLPKINIIVRDGALNGSLGSTDQVCGLILQAPVAPSGLALATPLMINNLADAVGVGITAAFDTTNSTNCYKQISDFYSIKDANGQLVNAGKELWIMIIVNTTLMATVLDVTQVTMAYALIQAANGRIKMLGVCRKPAGSYTATYTGQLDIDVTNARPKAQALRDYFQSVYKPFRVIIDGRDFQGTFTSLTNLRGESNNGVGVVLGADAVSTKETLVGLALGKFAAGPVQRNIGRVKDGSLGISAAFFNSTTDVKDIDPALLDGVNDKGYIFPRKHIGLDSYYFNDDPSASAITDDFSQLSRGRIIDKAIVVAYTTYVTELNDDLDVDSAGKISSGVAKYYQGKIETALRNAFFGGTFGPEVSDIKVVVDPNQNIILTNKVVVTVYIQPKAYSKTIEVSLGLTATTG